MWSNLINNNLVSFGKSMGTITMELLTAYVKILTKELRNKKEFNKKTKKLNFHLVEKTTMTLTN